MLLYMETQKSKLREIWQKAVENHEQDTQHYIGDSGEQKLTVEGMDIMFTLDLDNAISYEPISGGVSDLVYAKENARGSTEPNEVLQTETEFLKRVQDVVSEWRETY